MNPFFFPSISQSNINNNNTLTSIFLRNNNHLNLFKNINTNLNSISPNISVPTSNSSSSSNENDNGFRLELPFFRNNNNFSVFQNFERQNNDGEQINVPINQISMKDQRKNDEIFKNIFLPKTINNNINNEFLSRNTLFNINSDNTFDIKNNIRNTNIFDNNVCANIENNSNYKIETLFGNNKKKINMSDNNIFNNQKGGLFQNNFKLNKNPFLSMNNKIDNPFDIHNKVENPFNLSPNINENPLDYLKSKTGLFNPFILPNSSNNSNPFTYLLNNNDNNNNKSDNPFNKFVSNKLENIPNTPFNNSNNDINNNIENNIFLNDNNNYSYKLNMNNQRNPVFNSNESNRNNNNNNLQISLSSKNNFGISPSYKNNLIYIKEYVNNDKKNIKVFKYESDSSDISNNLEKAIFTHLENNYDKKEEKIIHNTDNIELKCQINEPKKVSFTVQIGKKEEISVLKRKICEQLKNADNTYNKIEEYSFCFMKNYCFIEESGKICGDLFSDCDNVFIIIKEIMKKHL